MEILNLPTPGALVFFLMFLLIYLFGYFAVFRNWSAKYRPLAASCLISLAHGTPALLSATRAIYAQTPRSFASANTTSQNLVLEYSMAYFLADLLHYIVFFPDDVLFIAHHLATLFVFATCRYVVCHGAYPILVLLVLAEATSACQNVWSLTDARKGDVPAAAKVHEFLCFPFYAFYSAARGIFGPLFVYEMGVFYATGAADDVIPRWVWVSWMVVIVAAIVASMLWVSNLWIDLCRERAGKVQKKMR